MFIDQIFNIMKMAVISKLIYRLNIDTFKIQAGFAGKKLTYLF